MKNESSKKQVRKGRREMIEYINLQLAALGQPTFQDNAESENKLANAKFM